MTRRFLVPLLVLLAVARAEDAFNVLADAGDVSTPAAAQATLDALAAKLLAGGGGTIVVTPRTTADFHPVNTYQTDRDGPAVAIVDLRNGTPVLYPSQLGTKSYKWTGFDIDRTMNMGAKGVGFWGQFYAAQVQNKVVSGSTSIYQRIREAVPAGPDARVYPDSIEGIFVGASFANYSAKKHEMFTVKSIAWDAQRRQYYFTADLQNDILAGGLVGTKNMSPALTLNSFYNADHQTAGVASVHTRHYGAGDCFNFVSRLDYQGNIMSTQGDEGAVVCELESFADLDPFRAEVESFDAATGELVYKPGMTRSAKLSMSRPLINLNEQKWLTKGHVLIVPPHDMAGLIRQADGTYTDYTGKTVVTPNFQYQGASYPSLVEDLNGQPTLVIGGLIVGSADAPWDESVVGRYFAVDDPAEKYSPNELKREARMTMPPVPIRRWYRIVDFARRPDGTKTIRIMRIRWASISAGSPTLFLADNYSWDGHLRPLAYVIAPGALPYDISDGWVPPTNQASSVRSTDADKRLLRLAPNGDRGTAFDFAPGDPIVQAAGADPRYPRLLQLMSADYFPSVLDRDMIRLKNVGRTARIGITFTGKVHRIEQLDRQKDKQPIFLDGIQFGALMGTGIRFTGQVTEAAMVMEQKLGNPQPLVWEHQVAPGYRTVLGVDPASGTMTVTGGDLDVGGGAVQQAAGISATTTPARNLRGIDVAVAAGATTLAIRFPQREADAAYAVSITPTWNTAVWVTNKKPNGFAVNFATPPPAGATFDWLLVR